MGTDTLPRPLLATPSRERAPALSPDGAYLAYVSDETGTDEVYVKRFLDTGVTKWPISNGGGVEPVWAEGGRELFYRNEVDQMIAVEVQTRPNFSLGQRHTLFNASAYVRDVNYHSYAVTKDGQRFIMIRASEDEVDPSFIVVENFTEELKARIGN